LEAVGTGLFLLILSFHPTIETLCESRGIRTIDISIDRCEDFTSHFDIFLITLGFRNIHKKVPCRPTAKLGQIHLSLAWLQGARNLCRTSSQGFLSLPRLKKLTWKTFSTFFFFFFINFFPFFSFAQIFFSSSFHYKFLSLLHLLINRSWNRIKNTKL